jgi:hypothetical protein
MAIKGIEQLDNLLKLKTLEPKYSPFIPKLNLDLYNTIKNIHPDFYNSIDLVPIDLPPFYEFVPDLALIKLIKTYIDFVPYISIVLAGCSDRIFNAALSSVSHTITFEIVQYLVDNVNLNTPHGCKTLLTYTFRQGSDLILKKDLVSISPSLTYHPSGIETINFPIKFVNNGFPGIYF